MKFYANQKVRIITVGDSNTVTSLQNNSTPGVYSVFRAKEGQNYVITLYGRRGNISGKLICWTSSKPAVEHSWTRENLAKKSYSTSTILSINDLKETGYDIPYYHKTKTGDIRIGVLFSKCRRGDNFVIQKITFRNSHQKSAKRDTCETPVVAKTKIKVAEKPQDIDKLTSYPTPSTCSNKILKTKRTLLWEEPNNSRKHKIELTVALPAKRAKKIIWLALESLRRQTNINFGWELICWEDKDTDNSQFIIESFLGKLPGCQRVIYREINPVIFGHRTGKLKGTLPLIDKWIGMASEAASTSRSIVLHACDCYSPPKRLYIHHQHFKNKNCYFSTQPRGLFFNLLTREKIFYAPFDSPTANPAKSTVTHLNMALRTSDLRTMRPAQLKSGIDGYILEHIRRLRRIHNIQNHIFHDFSIDKTNWMYGVDTDGANNISWKRKRFYKKPYDHMYHFFVPYAKFKKVMRYDKPEKYLPPEVISFLLSFKKK